MPISRVRCVTDTSVVLVTTTIAASSAMSEIGGPAAPIRSVIAVTKLRDASGVMKSNVSAAPGPEMAPRAHRDARVVFRRLRLRHVGRLREHLQARRGAEGPLERHERHPHVAVERDAAGRALLGLDADDPEAAPRDAHRLAERIDAGEQLVDDRAADHDDLRAADLLVLGDGAPALDADVANVEERRLRAVDRRVLERAPAGDDIAGRCAVAAYSTRSPATLSRSGRRCA